MSTATQQQPNFNEDDIERMLAELEAAAEGKTAPPAPKAASPQKKMSDAEASENDVSPSRKLADFSTYSVPSAADADPLGQDTTPQRKPLLGKLQPLGASPGAAIGGTGNAQPLPKLKPTKHVPVGALETKAVLSAIPSSNPVSATPSPSATSGRGGSQPASTETSPSRHRRTSDTSGVPIATYNFDVSLLPLVHMRPVGFKGITPRPRWGHTLTTIGDALYVFGGVVNEPTVGSLNGTEPAGTTTAVTTADFFEANTLNYTWDPVFSSQGKAPTPRAQHSAVSYMGKNLVVFGGNTLGSGNHAHNDIHVFDVVAQKWECVAADSEGGKGGVPTGRFGHSCVVHDDCLYVFGGKCDRKPSKNGEATKSGMVLSDEVFCFDLIRKRWLKKVKGTGKGGKGNAVEDHDEAAADDATSAANVPTGPCKRFNHSAAVNGNGYMYIHGGQNNEGPLSDTWAFHFATKTWTLVHQGFDVAPRSMHYSFFVGDVFVVVGGASELTVSKTALVSALIPTTGKWMAIKESGSFSVHPSKRLFGAAMHHGFVYILGGVAGAETPSMQMVRFLAMDGIPPEDAKDHQTPSIMRRLYQSKLMEDVFMELGGRRFGAHKFVLYCRAPKLWEELIQCRNVAETAAAAAAGGVKKPVHPIYSLEGNSRVKGLSSKISVEQLELLLEYLYTGQLPISSTAHQQEEDNGAPAGDSATKERLDLLADVAVSYSIDHLNDALQPMHAIVGRDRVHHNNPLSLEERVALSRAKSESRLVADITGLLDSGKDASAQVLFQDPHTGTLTSSSIHPQILINASDIFRRLLKPIICDGVAATELEGIHAKTSGSSGRRGVVVGAVPIPVLSVRFVLKYLYTGVLDVTPEAALSVMMAARTMRLPRLQAFCESIIAREEVNEWSCCDFMSLAKKHAAEHLHELCLLTGANAFEQTSLTDHYKNLLPEDQEAIKKAAAMLSGRTVTGQASAIAAGHHQQILSGGTVQKASSQYAESFARMN